MNWYYPHFPFVLYDLSEVDEPLSQSSILQLIRRTSKYDSRQILFVSKESLCRKCTGFSIIDSMPIKVCHAKRSHRNKVFLGATQKSKGTMGWYHGSNFILSAMNVGNY